MRIHKTVQNQLYEYLRGELAEANQRAVEEHLATCKQCSQKLIALRTVTGLMDMHARRPSEQRNELYWQQFVQKVERRVELKEQDEKASILRQLIDALVVHRKPFGVGFASAIAMVLVALGVWTTWLRSPVNQTAVPGHTQQQGAELESASAQNVALESQAQDYLEQSKVLLIGLVNTDPKMLEGRGPLLQREQEVSRKLMEQSAGLTSKLNDPSQRQLKELISDLQLILVQIANLGSRHDVPGVEIIKGGIEHNGILFKINLEQIQRSAKTARKSGQSVKRTT